MRPVFNAMKIGFALTFALPLYGSDLFDMREPLPKPERCFGYRHASDYEGSVYYIGNRACLSIYPLKKFSGIWIDQFEAVTYYDGAKTGGEIMSDKYTDHYPYTWFSYDSRTIFSKDQRKLIFDRLPIIGAHSYKVEFMGRITPVTTFEMMQHGSRGWGHMGASERLVFVERMIHLEEIEDPYIARLESQSK